MIERPVGFWHNLIFLDGIGHVGTSDYLLRNLTYCTIFLQTNKTTARIFPAVLDVENPVFQQKLDHLVVLNQKLIDIGKTQLPAPIKALQRVPTLFSFVGELLALFLMRPVESGSLDYVDYEAQVVY